ncbi:MAG TPA: serine/threonine-protein kinase [Kofleriaceae bacterium]|nr:serine/threonine-protein kinase [Kofleriaceae bacterium]
MKSCPTCARLYIESEDTCALDTARLVEKTVRAPAGVGRLLGSYQLVCLLGEGGMGNIYVGRHLQLHRYVAIKVLREELAKRKENVARFFHEAHTINRLHHPNIIESIDLVEDGGEGAYVVLELLKGHDLKTRLAHGALPIESAIHIGVQLADALGKVHALGVVHRDLKPENLILLDRDGRDDFVKLIDFGIAQIGFHGDGGIVGTAAYMAPEQGIANAPVDQRADIYSLGVLLFEMVTGQHPFPSATDSEYMVQHADTAPPKPSKLAPRCPPALEAVILRCLAKSPAERYGSADQVAAALRMVDPRKANGSRAAWVAFGLAFVGGAAAAAYFLLPPYLATSTAEAKADVATVAQAEPAEPQHAVAAPPAPAQEAPAPAPPPPPAAPAIVEIGIVSTPAGASVYRTGETVALGVTPFTVPLSRSDKPVQMRFEKAGFQPKTIEVPIAASLEIEVSLAKQKQPASKATVQIRKPAAKPVTDTKPKPIQREGTIDPFAK